MAAPEAGMESEGDDGSRGGRRSRRSSRPCYRPAECVNDRLFASWLFGEGSRACIGDGGDALGACEVGLGFWDRGACVD